MATVKLDPAKGIQIPNLTTTERNAISSPETGAIIWNTTTSEINQYNGSAWEITYTDTNTQIAGITSAADATAIAIDSSEKVALGGSTAVTSDSQVAIHGGNLELTTAGARYWIPRASDGALTGSLYSPSGSVVRLSGAGTSAGTIEFEPRSSNGVIARVTADGLCFGSDTAAANALDDYEEGSFTPVFTGHTGSAGSYDTGEHEARYTKVGRLVTIHWKLTLTNKGSWSGEVRMTGLPFTPAFTLNGAGSVELLRVNYSGGSVGNVNAYINSSQTYWRLRYTHDNDQANMVQVSECANNSAFGGTLSYIVA